MLVAIAQRRAPGTSRSMARTCPSRSGWRGRRWRGCRSGSRRRRRRGERVDVGFRRRQEARGARLVGVGLEQRRAPRAERAVGDQLHRADGQTLAEIDHRTWARKGRSRPAAAAASRKRGSAGGRSRPAACRRRRRARRCRRRGRGQAKALQSASARAASTRARRRSAGKQARDRVHRAVDQHAVRRARGVADDPAGSTLAADSPASRSAACWRRPHGRRCASARRGARPPRRPAPCATATP